MPPAMKRILLGLAWAAIAIVALGWLFGDTVRHHLGRDPNLRISFWGGYQEYEMWKEILARFREENPDIRLRIEYITDRYSAKIQQQLVSNTAPDVFLFQDEPFAVFCPSGKFEDLSRFAADPDDPVDLHEYWPTARDSFLFEGRPYGIPVWGGNNLIFVNNEAFRRAGVEPPGDNWTFDEFVETCRAVTRDFDGDGRIDQFAFVLPNWVYYLPWIWGYGARILDGDGRWAFVGPEAVAACRLYRDMRYRWHVSPSPWEATVGQDMGFLTGSVAMFCSGPWSMPFLNETDLDYDVVHVPTGPAGRHTRVTWDALVMFSGSRRKDEAWRLIRFATSGEAQRIVARYQRSVPALRSAADEFIRRNPRVSARKFVEAFDYARLQPITPRWTTMEREFRPDWERLSFDQQSPEETVDNLAEVMAPFFPGHDDGENGP